METRPGIRRDTWEQLPREDNFHQKGNASGLIVLNSY